MKLTALAGVFAISTILLAAGNSTAAHAEQSTAKPTASAKTVQVQPGDYLAKIADENQTTYPRLFAANENIKDPNVIYPGDTLRVPENSEQLPDRPLPFPQLPEPAKPAALLPAKPTPRAASPRPAAQPRKAAPAPVAFSGGSTVWDQLAKCESGGNWAINTGNGYYGGLQFSLASWRGVGGSGLPSNASREEQISRAEALKARQGWGAWPACSSKLGLR